MRCASALVAAGLVAIAAAQDRPPPQQPPVFRAGIDVVQLEVFIVDGDDRHVTGLAKQDVQVLEDGRAQEVVDVREIVLEDAGPSPVWAAVARPDVQTNDVADRRLLAIVMDDLRCCALPKTATTETVRDRAMQGPPVSDRWAIDNAKRIASQLIDGLGPGDLATVALTRELIPELRFTNDRNALREVVRRFAPITEGGCRPPPPHPDPALDLQRLLALSPQPLKAVVVLRSVVPISIRPLDASSPLPCPPRTYRIPDLGTRMEIGRPDQGRDIDPILVPPVPVYHLNVSGLQVDRDPLHRSTLFWQNGPNATGGRNYYMTNDLSTAVEEILRENRSYYLIGFRTSRPTVDGKYRRLEIKVARGGNYTVRSRAGYRRPTPPPKPGSREDREPAMPRPPASVAGLLANTDIVMSAAVAPFAAPGRAGSVLLTTLDLTNQVLETSASSIEDLTVRTVAYVSGSAKYDVQSRRPVPIPPGVGWVSNTFHSLLDVAPDDYELWLTAHEPRTRRLGGLFYSVGVPDFAAPAISLSGVVIGREPGESLALPSDLKGFVPIVPSAARTFGRGDEISAFFRVYQGRTAALSPVVISVRVLDDQGAAVIDLSDSLEVSRFGTHRAADYIYRLPLERLTRGRYLLTIEARRPDRVTPKRDVPFSVR
jgi:hypothetical protein